MGRPVRTVSSRSSMRQVKPRNWMYLMKRRPRAVSILPAVAGPYSSYIA